MRSPSPPPAIARRALLASALVATLGCDRAQSSARDERRAKKLASSALQPTETMSMTASTRLPALFIGHGSPMNAIQENQWSLAFKQLAGELPRPRAILCVSAHWYVEGTFVTGNERPETIHDFGGFPRELHEIDYPAPGDVELAKRVVALLGPEHASLNREWGLDHGTWTVLRYLRPNADCPVIQLSIDARLPGARHVELGRALAPLRDEGVLLLGSGNIVHNLRDAFGRMRSGELSTPGWAEAFDGDVARALEQHDSAFLARASETEQGKSAHPTPDHYLPLLYVAGAAAASDTVSFPISGFDLGSVSMRAVRFDPPSA